MEMILEFALPKLEWHKQEIKYPEEKTSDSASGPLLPLGAPRYRAFLDFFSGLIRVALFTASRAGTRFLISGAATADEIDDEVTASSYLGSSVIMVLVWGLFEFSRWKPLSYRAQYLNNATSERNDYELQRHADEEFDQSFRRNWWRVAAQSLSQLILPVVGGIGCEKYFRNLFTDSQLDHGESLTNALITGAFFVGLFTVGISYGIDKCFRWRSESFLEQLRKQDKNQFKMAMGLEGYDKDIFCKLIHCLKQKIAPNSRMKIRKVLDLREGKETSGIFFMDSKDRDSKHGDSKDGEALLVEFEGLGNNVGLFPYHYLDTISFPGRTGEDYYGFLYVVKDGNRVTITCHNPTENRLIIRIFKALLQNRPAFNFNWQWMGAIDPLSPKDSGPWVIMQIEALMKKETDLKSQPHQMIQETNLSAVRLSQFSWLAASVQQNREIQENSSRCSIC